MDNKYFFDSNSIITDFQHSYHVWSKLLIVLYIYKLGKKKIRFKITSTKRIEQHRKKKLANELNENYRPGYFLHFETILLIALIGRYVRWKKRENSINKLMRIALYNMYFFFISRTHIHNSLFVIVAAKTRSYFSTYTAAHQINQNSNTFLSNWIQQINRSYCRF